VENNDVFKQIYQASVPRLPQVYNLNIQEQKNTKLTGQDFKNNKHKESAKLVKRAGFPKQT
jgi:hypothetical protein